MDVTFFPVNASRRASDMFYGRSVRCFGDSTGVEATRQPIGTLPLPQRNFFETRKSAHGRTSIIMESHTSRMVCVLMHMLDRIIIHRWCVLHTTECGCMAENSLMIYNFNTLVDAQPKVIAAIIENKGNYKILRTMIWMKISQQSERNVMRVTP